MVKRFLPVLYVAILLLTLSGCASSLLGGFIESQPSSAPAAQSTQTAQEPEPEPQPQPEEPVKPQVQEPTALIPDADGLLEVPFSSWPFDVLMNQDPILIILEVPQSGIYQITSTSFDATPVYMNISSYQEDQALADNVVNQEATATLTAELSAQEIYLIGVTLLNDSDVNSIIGFEGEYLGPAQSAPPITVPEDSADTPAAKPDLEFTEEESTAGTYSVESPWSLSADSSHAVSMGVFSDDDSVPAENELSGSVEGTLAKADSPYLVTGDIIVEEGTTLTLEPGVVLRFTSRKGIIVRGTLNSKGRNGDEVVLTGNLNETPGAWGGIIYEGGDGTLEHTRVLFAGGERHIEGNWRYAAIHVMDDADPVITSCQIQDAKENGVMLYDSASPDISYSQFTGMTYPVTYFSPEADLRGKGGNSYTEVSTPAIRLYFDTIKKDERLSLRPYDALPYITQNISVKEGGSLSLGAGTIMKFHPGSRLTVMGDVRSKGKSGQPVILTSLLDDIGGDTNGDGNASAPSPGDWLTITVQNEGTLEFDLTRVLYSGGNVHVGGNWRNAALTIDSDGSAVITNSLLSAFGDGLLLFDNGTARVEDTIFDGIRWPVRSYDPSAMPTLLSDNRYNTAINKGIQIDYKSLDDGQRLVLTPFDSLPYSISELEVRNGGELILDPGTVLKLTSGGNIKVSGLMTSRGDAVKPVLITSAQDDYLGDTNGDGEASAPTAGDWDAVTVERGGKADLSWTRIAYAGGDTYAGGNWRNTAILVQDEGELNLSSSELSSIHGDGINLFDTARLSAEENAFKAVRWPFRFFSPSVVINRISGNTYGGAAHKGIYLDMKKFEDKAFMDLVPYDSLPFFIDDLEIKEGSSLALEEGTILKVGPGGRITVSGVLSSRGSSGAPAVITSSC